MDRPVGGGSVRGAGVRALGFSAVVAARPDRLGPVEDGDHPEAPALAQRLEQLKVYVPPLAHPRIAEKMVAAEPPQLRLGHLLEFPVVGLPDVEEREEIGIGMGETPVRRVRLGLLFKRPLARVLDAQPRGHDEDLANSLLLPRLEDHSSDGRIDGKAGELRADRRQVPRQLGGGFVRTLGCGHGAQLLQERIAGADGLVRRAGR